MPKLKERALHRRKTLMTLICSYGARNMTIRLFEYLSAMRVRSEIINTPRELSVGCGISVRFDEKSLGIVKSAVNSASKKSFKGIFRMDGRNIQKIY